MHLHLEKIFRYKYEHIFLLFLFEAKVHIQLVIPELEDFLDRLKKHAFRFAWVKDDTILKPEEHFPIQYENMLRDEFEAFAKWKKEAETKSQ